MTIQRGNRWLSRGVVVTVDFVRPGWVFCHRRWLYRDRPESLVTITTLEYLRGIRKARRI